jgi:hypothetical protein
MRPHPRRASTDSSNPRAWATCDRCGFVTNHYKLSWQFEWAGTQLINQKILVCEGGCLDQPQRQLGTIILPPDPTSIVNARVEQYFIDEYANLIMEPQQALGQFRVGKYGDPIYAEQSSPGNTTPIVVEFNQYFQATPQPSPNNTTTTPPTPSSGLPLGGPLVTLGLG